MALGFSSIASHFRSITSRRSTLGLCFLLVWLVPVSGQTSQSRSEERDVSAEMRNVTYHFTENIGVHILQLKGKLVPTKDIPVFDDPRSFILQIDSATLAMSTDALGHVLNDHVFSAPDAPLKNLVISTDGNQLKIRGKLAEKGNVSFEMEGEISATPEGKIRLHAKHIKAAHLPVKGVLDLFGVKLADLINTKKIKGVLTEKDDVILDPEEILPPPQIHGKVTEVKIENGQIVQVFGSGTVKEPAGDPQNFMAYHGATLRFGKLTMNDTDLVLVDSDPRDSFDFYLDHYRDQLVAGYVKTTPQFGLRVYMVDFNKLRRKNASRLQSKKGNG